MLGPVYLTRVQQVLPSLRYFDGAPVVWPSTAESVGVIAAGADSPAAVPTASQAQCKVCFNQLLVHNTLPGRLSDAVSEAAPPLYHYYLQLRTADSSLLCSFPVVLTPQEEMLQWQAQQAAEPAVVSKKAGKQPQTAKGSKADANAADQRNTWYQEVVHVAYRQGSASQCTKM